MKATNLALLDQAVENSVAWELGEGEQDPAILAELGVAPQRFRNVAGLRVVSNATRDALVDDDAAERQDRLLRYRTDRSLVLEKLKRVDVTPIATLPLRAWNRICDSAGLYRFVPKNDTVLLQSAYYVNEANRLAKEEDRVAKRASGLGNGLLFLCFTMILGALAFAIHGAFALFAFVTLVTSGAIFAGRSDYAGIADRQKVLWHMRRLIDNDRGIHQPLFRRLWPNFEEPDEGIRAQIVLPIPPPWVQTRLVAAERSRMDLHVAVVPEAIHFRRNLIDILMDAVSAKTEAEVKHPDLSRDPIAYVIEGTAVAIIDQYGDFPIEEDVIIDVVNSAHLV